MKQQFVLSASEVTQILADHVGKEQGLVGKYDIHWSANLKPDETGEHKLNEIVVTLTKCPDA